jgi:hypothetical protein
MIFTWYPNHYDYGLYSKDNRKRDYFNKKFLPHLKDNNINYYSKLHYINILNKDDINYVLLMFGDKFNLDVMNNVYSLKDNVV